MTMNKKSDDLLRGAAFHEAGHVVVAMNFGLAVGEIEISDDGSGRSQIAPPDHLPLVDQIALCVADTEAQELFNCHTHVLAAAADYGTVIELLDGLTGVLLTKTFEPRATRRPNGRAPFWRVQSEGTGLIQ